MTNKQGYAAYANNKILTASPAELTLMLYEGSIKFCNIAIDAVERKDISKAHNNIVKVENIIEEFQATLNHKYPVAKDFESVYTYLQQRLVEANIKKFIGQEDVAKEKIILGMPLYTRLWRTDKEGKVTSSVVNMKQIDSKLPNDVQRTWDEEKRQYYTEYESGKYKYQMWIEDEKSIREKLNLINQYELAGGAFWAKDRETDNIWNIAKEVLGIN